MPNIIYPTYPQGAIQPKPGKTVIIQDQYGRPKKYAPYVFDKKDLISKDSQNRLLLLLGSSAIVLLLLLSKKR